MEAIKVKQLTKSIGECGGTATATAVPLSLPASPATTPAQHPKAGVTFRDILTAVEQGRPLPPEANILEALVLGWVAETVSALAEIFGDSHYLEVGRTIQKLPKSDAILDAKISMLPLQLRRVAPLWRTFVRRLPPQARKLVSKHNTTKHKQKIVKRKVFTLLQKRNRSPTKRKAKDGSVEGDVESHSSFWFATVKPRATRAPNPCCPSRRERLVGFYVGADSQVTNCHATANRV